MTIKRNNFASECYEIGGTLSGRMLRAPQLKVLATVVCAVTVLVMHLLGAKQWATNGLCHDEPVLCNVVLGSGHRMPLGLDVPVSGLFVGAAVSPVLAFTGRPVAVNEPQWEAFVVAVLPGRLFGELCLGTAATFTDPGWSLPVRRRISVSDELASYRSFCSSALRCISSATLRVVTPAQTVDMSHKKLIVFQKRIRSKEWLL